MAAAICPPTLVLPASGCVAQLVEQLTLNQRVTGSIPVAPTKDFKDLGGKTWERGENVRLKISVSRPYIEPCRLS